jgi:hypothetical protein
MRTTPTVSITSHSVALDSLTGEALEIAQRNGSVTFTVYDADRRGLQGARVSLDGGGPRTTDARGQVSFAYTTTATPTQHEIAIEAPGKVAQSLTILL